MKNSLIWPIGTQYRNQELLVMSPLKESKKSLIGPIGTQYWNQEFLDMSPPNEFGGVITTSHPSSSPLGRPCWNYKSWYEVILLLLYIYVCNMYMLSIEHPFLVMMCLILVDQTQKFVASLISYDCQVVIATVLLPRVTYKFVASLIF